MDDQAENEGAENSEDEEPELEWFRAREGVTDDELERRRRQAIFHALDESENGLGFNELLETVEALSGGTLISRNTLKDRLERYEADGWIETPDDYQHGQKKIHRLAEKVQRPEEVNEAYNQWLDKVTNIWVGALQGFEEDDVSRGDIVQYVIEECTRYTLASGVIASGQQEYQSNLGEVGLPDEGIPPVEESTTVQAFYREISAELYKFYTEKIFGEVYIETTDKATQFQKDIMIETYTSTQILRQRMDRLWEQSPVPGPEIDAATEPDGHEHVDS